MSQDRSRSPASIKEEVEPLTVLVGESIGEVRKGERLVVEVWLKEKEDGMHVKNETFFEKEDPLYSFGQSPGVVLPFIDLPADGCRKSVEFAELKADQMLRHNQRMHDSTIELLNGVALLFEKNQEAEQLMMQMIQETQQLLITKLLPTQQQQPMQQQQPLQPAAAALQPQPQLGQRTEEEDESEKNASEDLLCQPAS